MNSCLSGRRLPAVGFVAALLSLGIAVFAQERAVRLRNQVIRTPPKPTIALQALATDQPVSGLFLIQFNGPFQDAWRGSLRNAGVELLRYVPDDTFVARFENSRPGLVRQLSFVRWVGEYRSEYKIHPQVRQSGTLGVQVLLAPGTSPQEALVVQRLLRNARRQSSSRFGSLLQGELNPSLLAAVSKSDAVLWIEPAPRPRLFDEISSKIVGGDSGTNGTPTVTQELGFDGSGVTVAVADSGLDNGDAATMHPDLFGRVDAFFFYGTNLVDAADEHSHGTHVTGIIAGNAATGETDEAGSLYGLGVASGAHIVAQRIFDGVGNYEAPPTYETLTHDAVRSGADIGSNSWGDDTQGRYDLSAAAFDALVRDADDGTIGDQPYILEFSAGNAGPGPQTIGSPAVAKNVIATGASQNDRFDFFIYAEGRDAMADFSSRGPCEDGRIKPDLVAPGTWIASLQSASATDENAWSPIDNYYQYQGGTSQAGPHASGAAAVFVQYYRETHGNLTPSPALVKAALINSAVDMDDDLGTDPAPNMDEGWGRIDLTQIIGSSRRYEFVDQTNLLATGQVHERRVVVASGNEPLKITMAYTDVPGLPAAIPALVNDLDLEVIAPDGQVYRGNQFNAGESIPDATAGDRVNNVEGVKLLEPAPGEYIIRVRAVNVAEDARRDTPAVDQDFALVVSADLLQPGVGVLFFDRDAYRAPDQIRIKLIDFELAGQPSVVVHVSSTTESAPEPVTLLASGTAGAFTNTVATVTGPPVSDGQLQVKHDDLIEAIYEDPTTQSPPSAIAIVDLVPPVIANVAATNRFGNVEVSWTTDELTTSIVRYGTNQNFVLAVTNTVLSDTHDLPLNSLMEGATYQYYVIAIDEAGNHTTNNNGGAYFSFAVVPAKNVLLVDAYKPMDPLFGTVEIPLTSYTDALDQTGLSYDVWDVNLRGSPGTNDLRPFRIVIWRYNDNPLGDDTISPQDQLAIESYVKGGGGFFISGMEILTRASITDRFRTNVLSVQSFVTDAGVPSVEGVDSENISSGMSLPLDYAVFDSDLLQFIGQSPDVSDTLTITTNAVPIFTDPDSGGIAGLRSPRSGNDTSGRVVFLSFPLDAVPETGDASNTRGQLMRNIMSYLAPGAGGLGTISFDSAAYTIPSRAVVEVGDSDLAGTGQASVMVYSETQSNGVPVTLIETQLRGLFRGSVALVSATNATVQPGQLKTLNGEVIWSEYVDASAQTTAFAAAEVDTDPPGITNIAVVTDYESADISWDTSEAADALVQFGESAILGRAASDTLPGVSHVVSLSGLRPDRTYYYQVVSRDVAGNVTVDDNHGQLYTFQTLKPITPPWSDNLEAGGTDWSVIDADGSEATWRLGVPNNGQETQAHSPPNAWGSNLEGGPIGLAQTFLVSPAIYLSGGDVATLRFWHSYDFTEQQDDFPHAGQLLIITNAVSEPITLDVFQDEFSTGWEPAQYDLTPYLGRVVYLAWEYDLISLNFEEQFPRAGWLVDDISVTVSTMTNNASGVLAVTNNLSQAAFALSGPVNQSGVGFGMVLTNVPPGQYVVSWSSVPFYQTPVSQTNAVASGGSVVFHGNYTFVDANTNGMSDAWEQQVFGSVSPGRTQTTDSDGDGQTDYAEFAAGTNPTDGTSKFEVPPPQPESNGAVKLQWPAVAGRSYRVVSSTNLLAWTPASDWIRANGTSVSLILPSQTGNNSYFYRVEVMP